jgi:addiction module HigA family antidote
MMYNPPHPGEVLEDSFGPDGLNITITEASRHLGVSRVALSRVVNGRAAISPVLAVRLEASGLSTARLWLAMQATYDLSQVLKMKKPKVQKFALEQPKAA